MNNFENRKFQIFMHDKRECKRIPVGYVILDKEAVQKYEKSFLDSLYSNVDKYIPSLEFSPLIKMMNKDGKLDPKLDCFSIEYPYIETDKDE